MADANRSELHKLLDRIPEQEVDAARQYLRTLVDPIESALLAASEDDEPLSEHERTAQPDTLHIFSVENRKDAYR